MCVCFSHAWEQSTVSAKHGVLFFRHQSCGWRTCAEFVKPPEIDHPEFTKMNSHYHYGPVIAIQRSPFFEDTLLTVGDWTFKIWKEGHSMPIFSSGCADQYLSAGCWSPTRPGVIYTAKEDGNLEVSAK